ncbi:MAG: S-layer protein, partial [Pirellula sp.]
MALGIAFATEPQTPHRPVSLVNDVVPILTKAGCNAGTCHAKAGNGQNGFQLSLLGFEPLEDYQHLVVEGRGRRLSATAPEQSLLLLKATGEVPHGGGARLQ